MGDEILDLKGLRCPQPVLKTALKANKLPVGSVIEVHADCPTFEEDVTKWINETGRVLISVVDHDSYKVATIQL